MLPSRNTWFSFENIRNHKNCVISSMLGTRHSPRQAFQSTRPFVRIKIIYIYIYMYTCVGLHLLIHWVKDRSAHEKGGEDGEVSTPNHPQRRRPRKRRSLRSTKRKRKKREAPLEAAAQFLVSFLFPSSFRRLPVQRSVPAARFGAAR